MNPVYCGLLDAQRTLAQLLSYHARWLGSGITMQVPEQAASKYLSASFLMGGLQVNLNPFEEKSEARSVMSNSTDQSMIQSCVTTSGDSAEAIDLVVCQVYLLLIYLDIYLFIFLQKYLLNNNYNFSQILYCIKCPLTAFSSTVDFLFLIENGFVLKHI